MGLSKQQEQGGAPTGVRKGELFWRMVAVLMLIVIGWVLWVLYQISPRSVVTPLAFESRIKPLGTQPATAPVISVPPTAPAPAQAAATAAQRASPEAAAAALAMDQAQVAARAGAHQASADIQAAVLEKHKEQELGQLRREGLKLSSEITTPLVERKGRPKK